MLNNQCTIAATRRNDSLKDEKNGNPSIIPKILEIKNPILNLNVEALTECIEIIDGKAFDHKMSKLSNVELTVFKVWNV